MPTIQLLDQNTINQIAAGEVVERPASVVKELVENAIDAGATAVTIEVKEGGLKLIRITDNGCGIEKDQVRTAFLRHSTSKIREAEDLITIASLGFRGEALASIAAVAMVELLTKTKEDMTGIRYVIEGGNEQLLEDVGCPVGTTFVIKDLFYNTPARLKFMKTPSTELGYVSDLISRMAMGNPSVAFKFVSNGKVKLQTSGKNLLKDCIYSVYGKEVTRNLMPVQLEVEGISIEGYVGKPHISRGNRTYENYYLNGRYIKSKVVERAIEDAFKSKLMLHRYPYACFHLKVDAGSVDVNVHPTKMEVRFMNEQKVYDLVYRAIDGALNKRDLIPDVKLDAGNRKKELKPGIIPAPEPFERSVLKDRTISSIQGQSASINDLEEPSSNDNVSASEVQRAREKNLGKKLEGTKIDSTGIGEKNGYYKAKPETKPDSSAGSDTVTKSVGIIDLMKPGAVKKIHDTFSILPKEKENPTDQDKPQADVGYGIPKVEMDNEGDETSELTTAVKSTTATDVLKDKYAGDQIELESAAFIDAKSVRSHKVVGQLFDTYWIVELDEKYYIIDQHAAHEKVLYEQMLGKIESHVTFGQRLLKPVVINLSIHEMGRYDAHKKLFDDLGFEVEPFGDEAVIVRSVPFIFDRIFDVSQFTQILDGLEGAYSEDRYGILLNDVATMACKAAVKGNDRLSKAEYLQLIEDLLKLEDPFHCPHGRPTIIAMTRYELEKKFKRIV